MPPRTDLKHILLPARLERENFKPVRGFDPDRPPLTARQQRDIHASKLETELNIAIVKRIELIQHTSILDTLQTQEKGICLDIEGSDQNQLVLDSLENRTSRIELLNVRKSGDKIHATIFIPENQLERFKAKVQKYGDVSQDQNGTKPTTIAIDSIGAIALADLKSFWMEDSAMPENIANSITWEVWLRKDKADFLRSHADSLGIKVSGHSLKFQECEICLLTSSLETLAMLQIALAPLVGFRYREAAPGFFADLTPVEQSQWSSDLLSRLQFPTEESPAICILDTGVHQPHSLLNASLSESDCNAYDPTWGTEDHHGHGTEMAGIALVGDLSPHLASREPIKINHRLESVKILPPRGENPEELYGWITQECAARAKVNAPHRQRIFCLAVTNLGKNSTGKPTAWSASIDKISMGIDANLNVDDDKKNVDDDKKQLFIVSVGNIRDVVPGDYSGRNDLEFIENPAQSWNALSVGGYTTKSFSEDRTLDGWTVIAQPGDIAPASRTSVSWIEKEWPIKPDVVFEGGNCVTDGSLVSVDPDLSLLTTGHNIPFKFTRDTSAATAEAARLAATIQAEYPHYWPETIRGLIVHSASWQEPMLRGTALNNMRVEDKENLLRRFGYGVPNINAACFSASNRACLISQHSLLPFSRPEGSSSTSYMDINYHKLPWPSDLLNQYGNTKMVLRITLSYFIEPSPSERIPTQKYSYASHRLKFALQRPLETFEKFKERVNKNARSEGYETTGNDNWLLGVNTRNRGSIVSDIWKGTAAELAAQETIAIMPEGGWWKSRTHLKRGNQRARYSLIVTLETDDQEIDIYTNIANQINVITDITTT
jgi:hypothetical protein